MPNQLLQLRVLLTILLICTTFSAEIFASSCFSSSPAKQKNIELTTELIARELTKDEFQMLEQMFKQMEGEWEGKVAETICKGTKSKVSEDDIVYEAESSVDIHSKHELKMSTLLDDKKEGKSRKEFIEMFLRENHLRINDEFTAGDIEIIQLSPNFVSFLKKQVNRVPAGGVAVRETVHTFSSANRKINIEYVVYFNGVLSSRSVWELMRK